MATLYIWGKCGNQFFHEPSPVTNLRGKNFVSVSCGGNHFLALTENGEVWAWGSSENGQLGLADTQEHWEPMHSKTFALLKALDKNSTQQVIQVSAGGHHSAALTAGGKVWCFGSDSDGQQGNKNDGTQLTPCVVLSLHKYQIIKVSCGEYHSIALSDDGIVFSWGNGENGKLGNGKTSNISTPTIIKSLVKIPCIDVVAGWSHSLAITSEFHVYSWGKGDGGRLGHGNSHSKYIPTLVQSLIDEQVRKASAGHFHTAFISNRGVYTCGLDNYGQLGLGSAVKMIYTPTIVDTLLEIKANEISCGGFHTVVLSEDGDLYFWGFLGVDNSISRHQQSFQYIPKKISSFLSSEYTFVRVDSSLHCSLLVACLRDEITKYQQKVKPRSLSQKSKEVDDIERGEFQLSNSPRGHRNASFSEKLGSFVSSLWNFQDPVEKEKYLQTEWQGIIKNWSSLKLDKKMKALWRKGIPIKMRNSVWKRLIQNKLNIQSDDVSFIFHKINTDENSSHKRLIEVDLPRTWAPLCFFSKNKDQTGPFYHQLLTVLHAYAMYCPNTGYVQGMSYIGGMLLLVVDSTEDTFVSLANLLNNHFFQAFFTLNIEAMKIHIRCYELLFSKHLPNLYNHFVKLQIRPEHYLLEWLLTIFSKSLPLSIACRIWDCFLFEGQVFLYRVAVGLIRILQPSLLWSNFEESIRILRNLPISEVEESKIFDSIFSISVPPVIRSLVGKINQEREF